MAIPVQIHPGRGDIGRDGAGHDGRDRDVAQQERVRERRRDVREALNGGVTRLNRLIYQNL